MIRVLTTFILAAIVLIAIWYFPTFYIQTFILLAILMGLYEYASLLLKDPFSRSLVIIFGILFACMMSWYPSFETAAVGLPVIVFTAFLWGLKKSGPVSEITPQVGLIVLGIAYLGLTLPMWGLIHAIGKEYVLLLLFPNCLTDTFGFLAGKGFGKHKMSPVVSPNKTWEGFFGSLFGGVFGTWLAAWLYFEPGHFSWLFFLFAGAGISLTAIAGDLIESLIKRSAGVKDSSRLIPGHGGALDRLDALIFTAPLFYLALRSGAF